MKSWNNEDEMFELMKEKLYTPVVGDILDLMGHSHQFLPPHIHPLKDDMKIAGRACTVLEHDVYGPQKKPFGLLTETLDQLQKNEVYVATGAHNSALWGELLTATARTRGAVGAVLDGYTRDTPQVLEQNFPVFAQDRWAQDSSIRTSVVDFRCPIEIGQVTIHDGDLVFADIDGVLIIPKEISEEVIEKAFEKAAGEKLVRKAIEGGMSATEAFAHFGIL
ncbi:MULTISPECIES: RraA family protein [unclassified Lacrimispora]|uniref:RraA family protein n=1 Tax=unclassified Lacrimispora TaxID=2719232 RepID=UPI0037705D9D